MRYLRECKPAFPFNHLATTADLLFFVSRCRSPESNFNYCSRLAGGPLTPIAVASMSRPAVVSRVPRV